MALIIMQDLLSPETKARNWRNAELNRTDIAATVSDYPNVEAYIAYRKALRDWPESDDFPDVRPALGPQDK
tara:strand:+ start:393 stop:605 length:213 start_codon:yes stop_codon:yes gene_type:complete